MRQGYSVLVVLVHQQSEYIRIHTDLTVGRYYGELGVDLWLKQQWIEEFEQHQVLVFTAQVFLNLVVHNVFRTAFVWTERSSLFLSIDSSLGQSEFIDLRWMSSFEGRWLLRCTDEQTLRSMPWSTSYFGSDSIDQCEEDQSPSTEPRGQADRDNLQVKSYSSNIHCWLFSLIGLV